ncbi:cytochrome P450 [Nocardia brasiliensis]
MLGAGVIPAGELVLVALASANRDERHFPNPAAFEPGRTSGHLAFGHGFHDCLGAGLARSAARIARTHLARRFR